MDRGTQWNKNREKKIYDRKIEIDKKEKEACTFRYRNYTHYFKNKQIYCCFLTNLNCFAVLFTIL